jgi:hypothetical protein
MGYRKVKFRHIDSLASMPWDDFERLMARHYAARGYRVEHSGTGANTSSRKFDGGIDLKLFRDNEYIVVQCKRESVLQVTHNVVHQLIGVMHTQHATRAVVVNTGEFSDAALAAAAEFPQVELIDGVQLRSMLAQTGDLPTTHWTDDILASMTETRSRRQKPRGLRQGSRQATVGYWVVKGILVVGAPLFVAYVFIPSALKTATAPLLHVSQRAVVPHAVATSRLPATPLASAPLLQASGSEIAKSSSSAHPALMKLSKKEAEEWEKKNAESMRILEKTTPSLE